MAEIFLARSRGMAGFARYVVLKRILPERGTDARWVEMFLDEARLVAQLQHPNIAQVFDLGRLGEGYFFTMEYVHGANMRETLIRCSQRGRQLPLSMALGVAVGAAAGLDHAHDRRDADGNSLGIVHRDVSPSNLMLSFDGVVKLVDFGVAKAHLRSSVTQSGTVKGKISYLSPEQCRGRDVDHRSDLFALGIVLYEMTTTKRLYRRASDFETMTAIVTEEPEPPSRYNSAISPALDALILRALAKDPAHRPQSASELQEALEEIAQRDGLSISNTHLRRQMRELYGEPLEPWRALESAPAKRETEVTYTADGLIEGSIRSLAEAPPPEGDDLDSVDVPAPNQPAVASRQPGRVTTQLKRTSVAPPPPGTTVDPSPLHALAATTFPVEVDASQVPLLDSLRAAIAATNSLEQSQSGVPVAAPMDESLPSVVPGVAADRRDDVRNQATTASTPASSATASTILAPSIGAETERSPVPRDARSAAKPSEAIAIPVVTSESGSRLSRAPTPLPSLLSSASVSMGGSLGPPASDSAAAGTPGTTGYTPRATLLGSAPAPTGTGGVSARAVSQPTAPPQPTHVEPMVYPRAPVDANNSDSTRRPPEPAPGRRLISSTAALVALVCVGVALGAYLALSGGDDNDHRAALPQGRSVEAGRLVDATGADADQDDAGPMDAGQSDAIVDRVVDPAADAGAVDATPLFTIDDANCRKVPRTSTVDVRRACVVFFCEQGRCSVARAIFAALPSRTRAELAALYPELRPARNAPPPPPQPQPQPPGPPSAPPPCKGPLCRR
jgi:serine/threonine protein kinase